MKKLISLALLLLSLLTFTSCKDYAFTYRENNVELFSLATSTLLGVSGSSWDEITVMESDNQGRILFHYRTNYMGIEDNELNSIMICQKHDSNYVFYYPDYHFVVASTIEEISEDDIAKLKEENAWDEPLNQSKMSKVKISERKGSYVTSSPLEKYMNGEFDEETEMLVGREYWPDEYGSVLYYVDALKVEEDSSRRLRSYMVILNEDAPEKNDFELIEDIWHYQTQFKEFKERNNWEMYVE